MQMHKSAAGEFLWTDYSILFSYPAVLKCENDAFASFLGCYACLREPAAWSLLCTCMSEMGRMSGSCGPFLTLN